MSYFVEKWKLKLLANQKHYLFYTKLQLTRNVNMFNLTWLQHSIKCKIVYLKTLLEQYRKSAIVKYVVQMLRSRVSGQKVPLKPVVKKIC